MNLDIIDLQPLLVWLWEHPFRVLPVLILTVVSFYAFKTLKKDGRPKLAERNRRVEKLPLDGRDEGEDEEGSQKEGDEHETYSDEEEWNDVPYAALRFPPEEMVKRSAEFYQRIDKRRSCRRFSSEPVPREVIENVIRAAGTGPSGAHTQPWSYVAVADPEMKEKIREIIEHEEYINYNRRMGDQWVSDLRPLKTDWNKPYLTEAPYIILLFRQVHGYKKDGRKQTHYYGEISTAISGGFLLLAIQHAGLVTVTTTPMNSGPSIRQLLGRPSNEKLLLLFPVGLAPDDIKVPDLTRKTLDKFMTII